MADKNFNATRSDFNARYALYLYTLEIHKTPSNQQVLCVYMSVRLSDSNSQLIDHLPLVFETIKLALL